jgi:putative flippase GtrA
VTFLRYLIIQAIAYAIDMGLFVALLYSSPLDAFFSNILSKIAAGIFAFLVHQNFTFRVDKSNKNKTQAIRYFILLGLNVPISSMVLSSLLHVVEMAIAAKFMSDVFCVLLSFYVSKKWVFPSSSHRDASPQIEGRDL